MGKIKENTFLSQELHSQVVDQSEITGASKSAIIAEAVKVYYSMSIDERIARVNNRIKELKEEIEMTAPTLAEWVDLGNKLDYDELMSKAMYSKTLDDGSLFIKIT